MKKIITIILMIVLLSACAPAQQIEVLPLASPTQAPMIYYVGTKGSDANLGREDAPFKTIQRAINIVPSGATIIVTEGDYPERPVILASKSNLTIQAHGKVTTRGFHIARNSGTVIDGFEITAKSSVYVEGFGIWIQGTNCIIRNNYIHDTAWGGILTLYYTSGCTLKDNKIVGNVSQNGIDLRGTNHIVEGNEIADVRQMSKYLSSPPSYADADGIHFHGSGHIIRNNYIHDIPYGGDNVDTHTDCMQTWNGGTEQPQAVNVIVENNRCENIDAITNEILTKGMQVQHASGLIVRNNIFCAAVGLRMDAATGLIIENNELCGNPELAANIVSDCIQFANAIGTLNSNYCRNFSGSAVRLDGSNTIKTNAPNFALNTKLKAGTEYLFTITLTSTPSKVPTITITKTATLPPTVTPTATKQITPTPTAYCVQALDVWVCNRKP